MKVIWNAKNCANVKRSDVERLKNEIKRTKN